MLLQGRKYTFYISITMLLVTTVLVLSSLFFWISHRESRTAAIHTADSLFYEINTKTMDRYENALVSISLVANLGALMPGFDSLPVDGEIQHPSMDFMFRVLAEHDYIYSTYIGYFDGSFVQIIAIRDKQELLGVFGAPPGTVFVFRTITTTTSGARNQSWYYLDHGQQIIGLKSELDPDYDPRGRVWYKQAVQESATFYTDPYIFSSYKVPGITCAAQMIGGSGVFGVDITLDRFSASLQQQQISENGLLFLFDRSGRIIISPQEDPVKIDEKGTLQFLKGSNSELATVRAVVGDYLKHGDDILGPTREITINGSSYLVMLTGLNERLKFDQIIASIAPVSDFTGFIRQMQKRVLVLCVVILAIIIPLALLVSKRISGSLTQLEIESEKIRQRDFSDSLPLDSSIKEIHTLIRAFDLMKSTIRQLLEQQRELFDDFTKLIAGAIDAKSAYTGGHCARVPIVAEMLVDAACKAQQGPFAGFDMKTADEHWEFEIAAWLHDCGKVTTPEYVVDKATKLETIYNRIHEIRMRFEVVLRDAEIEYYQNCIAGREDNKTLLVKLEDEKRRIEEDFNFVAACNIGGEFMDDSSIERLERVASRTWTRYLDDRIGISEDEAALKQMDPAPVLPVDEKILTDKPYHVIERKKTDSSTENINYFNMEVPEHQYNFGELYNLTIRKGTLSEEDRFKIQEHIIQTINMLNRLEFPEYLAKVPEYAGAHHETMIGTGYPKGLTKEDMSIPARIMAIADIFEALTAADRPYKKPKKLSDTLKIMSFMCEDQHIDGELFNLFLQSSVYQKYADEYLDQAQIDKVDIGQYLYTVPDS